MIEIPLLLIHKPVMLPGLGNSHSHGKRKLHTVHIHEFQSIVQHGGIGTVSLHHREYLLNLLVKEGTLHGFFTGQHPVNVSLDGIDLSVMGKHAVGVSTIPAGSCIC